MALRESGEDYLESIYVLSERQGIVRSIDVAEYLGVTKASVSKAMAALESTGYVEMGKRDVHLTERGLEVARQMWERHCFFVGLLEDAGVSAEVASQEGCHMEHCLSEESFEKLRAMLGLQLLLKLRSDGISYQEKYFPDWISIQKHMSEDRHLP